MYSFAVRYGDVTPSCDFPLCVLCTSVPELSAPLGLLKGCSALTKQSKSGGWLNSPENKQCFLGLVARWPWSIVPITGLCGTWWVVVGGQTKPNGEPAQGDAVLLQAGWGCSPAPSSCLPSPVSVSAKRRDTHLRCAESIFCWQERV